MNTHRKPYDTDVADEEWQFVAPYLRLMTEDAPQREHALRDGFDALQINGINGVSSCSESAFFLCVQFIIVVMRRCPMPIPIQVERENDGRWLAEIPDLPGVLAYGATPAEAIARVQAVGLRTLADRVENGEAVPPGVVGLFAVPA